jgi:parallel beta-helix repeat protein
MKLSIISAAAVFVFLLTGSVAQAATYYVDGASLGGACSDVASGTSLGAAWCTVQKAATTAVAGDTVYVRGGTYRETITIANSGTSGNPITFAKYGSETPIINGGTAGSGWASLASTEPSAGIITEGFEGNDDTFAAFTSSTVDSGNTLAVEPDVSNLGTYSAKATFGGTNRNARVSKTITSAADVYQRMYFRFNSAYNITVADVGQLIMNERIDSAVSRATVELVRNSSNQFYIKGRATNPATNAVTTFVTTAAGSVVPDTWYAIEIRYKGGDASTGGAELWIDGVSQGTTGYNWNTSTTTIGRLEWGSGTSGTGVPSSGSIFYIDDIKASTTPVGLYTTAGATTTYKMTGVTAEPIFVYQDGTLLSTSTSALSTTLSAGNYYYDDPNDILYLRTSDSTSPSTKTIDIPFRTQGIVMLNKEYITLNGLSVKYTRGSGNLMGGVILGTSSNITIQDGTFADNNGAGIFLQKSATNTISSNTILRNRREFGGGIRMENGSNNNTITSNTITGIGTMGGNGILMCGDDTCSYNGNNFNTIRGNTFYNLRDSCIYIGSYSDSNIFERNLCGLTFRITSSAGSTAGGSGAHVSRGSDYNVIRNNIFYDTGAASIVVQSNTIDSIEIPVYGNLVYNNTIYNPVTAGTANNGGIAVLDDAYDTVVKNNIVYQSNDVAGIRVTGAIAASSTISDYNLYYSTQSGVTNLANWGVSSGRFHSTFASIQAATGGQEAHSLSVDPLFVSATSATSTQNFTLQDTSPAINAGATLLSVVSDYAGTSRPQGGSYDMGAYDRTVVASSDTNSSNGGGGGGGVIGGPLSVGFVNGFVDYFAQFASTTPASSAKPASGLSETQVQSILSILTSFGVDADVLKNVEASLRGGGVVSMPSNTNFTRDLELGDVGDDVKALQQYLNTHGFVLATVGPGSAGSETIKFGAATKAALVKFQKANGITPAAGYFGPKTRAIIVK